MHELSEDGTTWGKAPDVAPDIFGGGDTGGGGTEGGTSEGGTSEGGTSEGGTSEGGTSEGGGKPHASQWHYNRGGEQEGPESLAHLKELVSSGKLRGDHEVWTDGMTAWTTVDHVPELKELLGFRGPGPGSGGSTNTSGSGAEVTNDLLRTLTDSRPWIMFIAITGFIYVVALIALGLLLIIMGAKAEEFTTVALGLTSFLYAAVIGTGGAYLMSYHARIAKCVQQGDQSLLEAAMRTLRGFWVFVSIVLIVVLVNTVVGTIWLFSAGIVAL
jgi:hypothetical protein